MSHIGYQAAATIVHTDTLAMIFQADNIVRACTGTNCNVSPSTRTTITQQLSMLAQDQATATLFLLSIPSSSVLGRNIYEAYLDLGAAVASVYNFQCGDVTVNSTNCVTNASSVQTAQSNLQNLLITPAINETNHILILSILFSITIITSILFFIFLIIGLFQRMFESPTLYMTHLQDNSQVPIMQPYSQVPIMQPYSQVPIIQTSSQVPIIQTSSEVPIIQTSSQAVAPKVAVPVSPFNTDTSVSE